MPDCKNCVSRGDEKHEPIPYEFALASEARHARTANRLIVSLVIAIVIIAGCVGLCYKMNRDCLDKIETINRDCLEKIEAINKHWIEYLNEYDFESYSETYEVELSTDGGGNANYIGNDGDINNGSGSGSKNGDSQNP